MAWRRTGDTPLPEPILSQITDAYMRHSGEMSLNVAGVMQHFSFLSIILCQDDIWLFTLSQLISSWCVIALTDASRNRHIPEPLRIGHYRAIPSPSHNTWPKAHIPSPSDYLINRMLISLVGCKRGGCPAGFLISLKGLVAYRRDIHDLFTDIRGVWNRIPSIIKKQKNNSKRKLIVFLSQFIFISSVVFYRKPANDAGHLVQFATHIKLQWFDEKFIYIRQLNTLLREQESPLFCNHFSCVVKASKNCNVNTIIKSLWWSTINWWLKPKLETIPPCHVFFVFASVWVFNMAYFIAGVAVSCDWEMALSNTWKIPLPTPSSC